MIGNRVRLALKEPDETLDGELRSHTAEGVWLYHGAWNNMAVYFYPIHRVLTIVDLGPVYR